MTTDHDECAQGHTVKTNHGSYVAVPTPAIKLALGFAERSVEEVNSTLRDAEGARDSLARNLGESQRRVDMLLADREVRTKQVRLLRASLPDR